MSYFMTKMHQIWYPLWNWLSIVPSRRCDVAICAAALMICVTVVTTFIWRHSSAAA